jgi:hypothetical protein
MVGRIQTDRRTARQSSARQPLRFLHRMIDKEAYRTTGNHQTAGATSGNPIWFLPPLGRLNHAIGAVGDNRLRTTLLPTAASA